MVSTLMLNPGNMEHTPCAMRPIDCLGRSTPTSSTKPRIIRRTLTHVTSMVMLKSSKIHPLPHPVKLPSVRQALTVMGSLRRQLQVPAVLNPHRRNRAQRQRSQFLTSTSACFNLLPTWLSPQLLGPAWFSCKLVLGINPAGKRSILSEHVRISV